jgi:hypothetical protein
VRRESESVEVAPSLSDLRCPVRNNRFDTSVALRLVGDVPADGNYLSRLVREALSGMTAQSQYLRSRELVALLIYDVATPE